jgi:hypothetical protein
MPRPFSRHDAACLLPLHSSVTLNLPLSTPRQCLASLSAAAAGSCPAGMTEDDKRAGGGGGGKQDCEGGGGGRGVRQYDRQGRQWQWPRGEGAGCIPPTIASIFRQRQNESNNAMEAGAEENNPDKIM